MMVYRYWVEPATAQDAVLLMRQLARAAEYRRELTAIENRARVLTRAILSLPKDQRGPYYKMVQGAQRTVAKQARDRARADRPVPIIAEDGPGWLWHGDAGRFGGRLRGGNWDLGCSWGTCGMVDDAHDQSQRTTSIGKDLPTFVPGDEGVLAVQYQQHPSNASWRPTSAASLVGGEGTMCRIGADLVGKKTLRSVREGHEGGAKRLRTLMFRIGSEGARPIWANLYTFLHRPLPDARVVWVKLVCRRVALRHRWSLIVVTDAECRGRPDEVRGEAVGIDIGWRKMPAGGIRVAYWYGTDGAHGELVIPDQVIQRKGKSDSLQGIRDRERNEVSALWRAWLQEVPDSHPVRVAATAMHQWLQIRRYVSLYRLWEVNRIPGDEAMFGRVTAWLKHDRHLYAWQVNNLRRMRFQVEARIQDLAVELARRYAIVAVEERGMVPELVRRDDSMDDEESRLRRLNATRVGIVAPAFARAQLERFTKKYGGLYREINPANTTRRCAACGALREVRDPALLMLRCDACGAEEDQDLTSSKNIARIAVAQVQDETARAVAVANSGASPRKMGVRRTRKSLGSGAGAPT